MYIDAMINLETNKVFDASTIIQSVYRAYKVINLLISRLE